MENHLIAQKQTIVHEQKRNLREVVEKQASA
jgi:hypothetical protein